MQFDLEKERPSTLLFNYKTLPRKRLLKLALSCRLGLFLALDAGLFVMLSFAQLRLHAAFQIAPFKSAKRAVYGFVFLDLYFCHLYVSLPPTRTWSHPSCVCFYLTVRSISDVSAFVNSIFFKMPRFFANFR